MAAVDLADLTTAAGTPRIGRVGASEAAGQRFAAAMDRANGDPAAGATPSDADPRLPAAGPATAADGAGSATADAQERARRALNLGSAKQQPAHGEAILNGLQNIRGVFTAQVAHMNELAARPRADVNTLMALQMEVAKFALLVDVTSKLTGKSTQALETLLKSQ